MRKAFGAEFEVTDGYLDTPAVGIPSAEIADAIERSVGRWRVGADRAPSFDSAIAAGRAGFADLIGVSSERVAIGGSVSQLAGQIAAGISDGARVLSAANEFTSVTFPIAAQGHRGISITEVSPEEIPQRAPDYDLVAASVVQSADGAVLDLDALRQAKARSATQVLLDVTQAAGWLPLRLDWADWVIGGSYKWLLCPRGAAWMSVHPRAMERTLAVNANWYAGEDRWDTVYGLPLRLARDARRFDLSPAWLPHVAAATALPYLASLDREQVYAHCTGLADLLRTKLGHQPRGSAIVALQGDGFAERLAGAGVRASTRAGKVRLGFHVYNTTDDVELAYQALR